MNLQQVNVLLLGAAFHLLFFSFQTSVFIQQTVVNSIRLKPEYNFTGDGYVSLCITYAVFALANWLAPSVIALTGAKYGMFLGALTYVLYSASFIQPTTSLFYLAAALIGLGAGLLWTAQGSFLAHNSTSETASRNAAIFWSMLQSSILFGNLFVYFAFDSQAAISDQTRHIVYGVLTLVGGFGTLVLLLLREKTQTPPLASLNSNQEADDGQQITAWGQFVSALKLAKTCNMLLLSTAFLFTGQLLSFFTGVYGTAIGATSQFGPEAKRYIGLAGIFIGVGEILGGSIFGLLGEKVNKRLGRDSIFLFGYLVTLVAIALTFINLPPDSPLVSEAILPTIIEPRIWISMVSSVLIGLGDACFNTQIYSLLMSVYQSNSVGAFALFKFVQSAGSAIAFLYSTKLNLYYQLLILALISTIATICFCLIEWNSRRAFIRQLRRSLEKTDSQQDIITNDSLAAAAAAAATRRGPSTSSITTTSSLSSRSSVVSSCGGEGVESVVSSVCAKQVGRQANAAEAQTQPFSGTPSTPLQYAKNILRSLGDKTDGGGGGGGKSGKFSPHQDA